MKAEDMKIFLVFGIAVLAVVAAIVIWQRSVQHWIESDYKEAAARETVQGIKQLEGHLAMVESGRRDYAIAAVGKDMRILRQLVAGDEREQARWETMETLLAQSMAQWHGNAAPNKELQDQIHKLLQKIGEEESLRLHQRIEHKQTQMFSTVSKITAILCVGTVLFLCVFWLLRREIVARRAVEAEIRKEHAALEKTMRELEQSHWHLDKVAEFLPICMECGRVKTADTHWEPLIDYFRKNELFLTHGLCPQCAAKVRKDFTETRTVPPQQPA
jgi:CHASE3 domain sensor protein